jgi:FMN-dependent NADH-azoreductase
MSDNDIISKSLDLAFSGVTAEAVVPPKTTNIDGDFDYARENIKQLIANDNIVIKTDLINIPTTSKYIDITLGSYFTLFFK